MAEGVVSFGIQKLWELLSQASDRLQGVGEQVAELKRQLGTLQSLLEDADAKKHESKRVRNFLEDVKDIVYDAEDVIKTFLLKEERRKEKGIKKRVRRLASFLVDRQKMASDFEGFTVRISEVVSRMQSFGIKTIIAGDHSLSMQERQREQKEIRQTFPKNSESGLVGVEQSVEELVNHFVENDNIQVVSISGMGGIGKTTLARQVFHHDIIRRHFDGLAWVYVSQHFTQKHVWQRILQDLRPHDGDISHMDEYTLQCKLFQLLETKRYLIVLDDIWKEEDWDRIKTVFPPEKGWKMLLTSRNEIVGLHADPTCISFRPRILTPEESWKLCKGIVFSRRDKTEFRIDEELEAMGKKMVTFCGGLPLAAKVLGGLLAAKHTIQEWKKVCDNIRPHIVQTSGFGDNNLNSIYQVLALSYEDLPRCLKQCFLYLAHFPEEYKINVEMLFSHWAADGIITSFYDGLTIRDSAERYLEELARRNIVVAERSYLTLRIEYCQMHDIMREVCLSIAIEENFLQIVKVPTSTSTIKAQSPSRSRRLAVHSGNILHLLGDKTNQKFRSLMFFGVEDEFLIQSQCFKSLPFLRVLDLSGVKFEGGKLPSSIGELIHLRFLSLHMAGVSHLPSSMRKLKLLLYLHLGVDAKSVHMPNVLKDMLELRYLILPKSMHDETMLELGDLVNLETLRGFSTKHSYATNLLHMNKLRVLSVWINEKCTFETLLSSLRGLKDLETLSIYDLQDIRVAYPGREFLQDFIHLNHLTLVMHMPRLPDQHRFPPHLAQICLFQCRLVEDPMPTLENLLQLKSVILSFGAFVGKKMVCSKGGFSQLRALKLSKQEDLEDWRVEEGSMTCLGTLTIKDCKRLKKLPYGLKFITSLKKLKIKGMEGEWKEKLVAVGKDYYKIQHIPRVQFINSDTEEED